MDRHLGDIDVLIAGAGLAGLTAARALSRAGASVRVVEARSRPGGRVWTVRSLFEADQSAEAGGELIEAGHETIRRLAEELGIRCTPVLRRHFGFAQPTEYGDIERIDAGIATGWRRLAAALETILDVYCHADQSWDSPVAASIARLSVAEWLDDIDADRELRLVADSLRGFFLADKEQLSLLQLVDLFAGDDDATPDALFRIMGGADRLTQALAAPLGERLHLETELLAVTQDDDRVRFTVQNQGRVSTIEAAYAVLALPASTLRFVRFQPALPHRQQQAIQQLRYGGATKTLLQFDRRFWRRFRRPNAYASPLMIGAVWEANEEQLGRPGILALLAGGSASGATRALTAKRGVNRLADELEWLTNGLPPAPVQAVQVCWEDDPWARGGYAFFDPTYDPSLRAWLARPCGRLFFAGEHTSLDAQGYMEGAVASGYRASAELAAVAAGIPSESHLAR